MTVKTRSTVVALGFALAFLLPGVLRAEDEEKVDPAYEKRVLESAGRIEKEVEKLRGLKFQAPVRKGVQAEAALKRLVIAELDKPENLEELESEEKVAKAFGLVPQDFQWKKEVAQLLGDQIAGYYDNESKKLRLVEKKGGLLPENMAEANDEIVMAHELEHALQDQNFDLGRWFAIVDGHLDRTQAWKSVVEGEATFLMMKYAFNKQMPGMELPDLRGLMEMNKNMSGMVPGAKEQQEKLEKLPPYLVKNLTMPYEEGAIFVQKVFQKGGWEAVTKLFHDPPSSTNQVLHPKNYFERVEPREFAMPNLAKAVNGKSIDESTLGEFNIRLLLEAHGIKERNAKRLASGWRGDRYQAVSVDGKTALVWISTWEDAAKATAFADGYREGLEKRRSGAFQLEVRETEVLLVDADDAKLRQKLAKKAWASAMSDGRLRGLAGIAERPPATDFTDVEESVNAFGSTAVSPALAPRITDEELGISYALPKTWKKQEKDTIKEIRDFSRGLWTSEGGVELRILDLPMPFDKENLLRQFEEFVKRGTKEYKKHRDGTRTLGGREAVEVEFEGIVPDGTNTKRQARAIAVERDQMTLLFLVTAPEGKLKGELGNLEAALGTLRFLPVPLAGERTFKQRQGPTDVVLATAGTFERHEFSGRDTLLLEHKEGKARIQVESGRAPGADLERDRKATEELRKEHLDAYRSLAGSVVEHDHLGKVHVSDFEFKTKEGDARRVREVVAFQGGRRYVLTCSSAPDAFEKHKAAFERAIGTFRVEAGAKPEARPEAKPEKKPVEPRKPEKKPADEDEPF